MRLIKSAVEPDGSGSVTLLPEEPEDMWHAYNLIRPNDILRASAIRRVTTEKATSTASQRVHLTLSIRVNSTDFDAGAGQLHVAGRIDEENKHVKKGAYHTLDLELQRNFTLIKDEGGWDSVARATLREATDPVRRAQLYAVCMQEGIANICIITEHQTLLRQRVFVPLPSKRPGGVQKKHDARSEKFFRTTLDTLIRQMDPSEEPKPLLLASPGYIAADFQTYIKEEAARTADKQLKALLPLITVTHASSSNVFALNEVLATPAIMAKLKDTKYVKETALIDRFFTLQRADDGRAWYGPTEVVKAVEAGAVGRGGGVLLISNALFRSPDVRTRRKWVSLVDRVREVEGGEVRVFSSEHESGRRLETLGSIAAILTFPIDDLDEDTESDAD